MRAFHILVPGVIAATILLGSTQGLTAANPLEAAKATAASMAESFRQFAKKVRKEPKQPAPVKTEAEPIATPASARVIKPTIRRTAAPKAAASTPAPKPTPLPVAQLSRLRTADPSPKDSVASFLVPPPISSATPRPDTKSLVYTAGTVIRLVDDNNCVPGVGDCDPGVRQNHRSGIIGEFLYIQARTMDIPYATPVDGVGINAVPVGMTLMANPTHQPGFRVGFTANRSEHSSISAHFWHYQSQTNGSDSLPGGTGFYDSLLVHPNTTSVATDSLSASINYDIDFDMVDAHYRTTLIDEDLYAIDLTAGVRYARIDQDFTATYSILGETSVDTDLGFDGVGPRLGLEFERPFDGRFHLFVRSYASMLLGHATAEYTQTNVFSGTQATTSVDDSRFVPVTELEIGVGWDSPNGNWRFSTGYYIGTFHNALSTQGFIQGVQNNNVANLENDLTFDGLQARIEVHW
jgi:hypothetical protein